VHTSALRYGYGASVDLFRKDLAIMGAYAR
jgi:hypothetical protein